MLSALYQNYHCVTWIASHFNLARKLTKQNILCCICITDYPSLRLASPNFEPPKLQFCFSPVQRYSSSSIVVTRNSRMFHTKNSKPDCWFSKCFQHPSLFYGRSQKLIYLDYCKHLLYFFSFCQKFGSTSQIGNIELKINLLVQVIVQSDLPIWIKIS